MEWNLFDAWWIWLIGILWIIPAILIVAVVIISILIPVLTFAGTGLRLQAAVRNIFRRKNLATI